MLNRVAKQVYAAGQADKGVPSLLSVDLNVDFTRVVFLWLLTTTFPFSLTKQQVFAYLVFLPIKRQPS
jgi:phage shock protein PspC (stress-responsive transcriptional regulator)